MVLKWHCKGSKKLIANTTLRYARHNQQHEEEWHDDVQSISDMLLFLNFYFLINIFEKSAMH